MNKKLIMVLTLAFLLNLFFCAYATQYLQVSWWDESEYLAKARNIVRGTPIGEAWAEHREIIPVLFYMPFFAIGLDEFGIRAMMMLVAVFVTFMTYLAIKELFINDKNKERLALLSAFGMSILWTSIFFTTRVTMYIIAPAMFLSAVYFWAKYMNTNKLGYVVVSFIIAGLGMTVYYNTAFLVPIIGLYLLSVNRNFYKDKNLWIAGVFTLLLLTPYFIYSQITYGSPIPRLTAVVAAGSNGEGNISFWDDYFSVVLSMLTLPLAIILIAGFLLMYEFWLSIDLVFSGKDNDKARYWFLILWIAVPFFLYSLSAVRQGVVYDAYLLVIFPALFFIIAKAVSSAYDFLASIHKLLGLALLIVFLGTAFFFQVSTALYTIGSKVTSFSEIREAGYELRSLTQPGDIVVSASVPQLTYYSEREISGIGRDQTAAEWEAMTFPKKPKYLLLTRYEPHPSWLTDQYLAEKNITFVKTYGQRDGTVMAGLFKFPEG